MKSVYDYSILTAKTGTKSMKLVPVVENVCFLINHEIPSFGRKMKSPQGCKSEKNGNQSCNLVHRPN